MMTDPTPIKRGPGRPRKVIMDDYSRKLVEVDDGPSEPTAAEQIAALNERRAAGKGYIIAPPETLTPQSFRSWLHSVADIGSPDDVVIAWHRCENAILKGQLENEYVALKNTAGAR